MRPISLMVLMMVMAFTVQAQTYLTDPDAARWADSVLKRLSGKEKIAQLMVMRASDLKRYYTAEMEEAVRKYKVGGVCFFQGGPVRQASLTNQWQRESKVPLLVTMDGEYGLGMRLDSVSPFQHQMMIGAGQDATLVYRYGQVVGEQCKRLGVQVNYAPVVDVNNNPNNPVINDRSFGEDKYRVAEYGVQYMKGMQDAGIIACAKHFPGHGDTETDSHLDLPVINKTMVQLDSLELYPFKQLFKEGVGSVMVAHLFIPSIDDRAHRATSISYNNVTKLMRNELGYKGLVFTDALNMEGVAKYFPKGAVAAEALVAGNDMLCLPEDIPAAIKSVKKAIKNGDLTWEDIDVKVRKVLLVKYATGLAHWQPIDTVNLTKDLNRSVDVMRQQIALQGITLLRRDRPGLFPLKNDKKVAYIGVGADSANGFALRMEQGYNAHVFYFGYKDDSARIPLLLQLLSKYDAVVVGVHGYDRRPANHYKMSDAALSLLTGLAALPNTTAFVFGNPYAIVQFAGFANVVACYEDDVVTQNVAADMLQGKVAPMGKLPVRVGTEFAYGTGLSVPVLHEVAAAGGGATMLRSVPAAEVGVNESKLKVIDSLVEAAIVQRAIPGCVVLAARKGKIFFNKAYGHFTYDGSEPVKVDALYDLASVTKVCATTMAVMKLYDEGKIDLDKTLGDYLPWVRGSNKEGLVIRDVMLHQAGLDSYIPFYKDVMDKKGNRKKGLFKSKPGGRFTVRVAANMYMRNDQVDVMLKHILESALGPRGKYVYSDLDFIFMWKVVEAVSGVPLEQYVRDRFYTPMGMTTTGFRPFERFALENIAPTEREMRFRQQLLRGDVHDAGAAMFGEVSGHAGLFSNAYDLAVLLQMLLDGGSFNGDQYLSRATVQLFTGYNSAVSRRGIGFDKPEKDNATRKDPYPCVDASPETFGHTGFTGTCIWVDPKSELVFVFLSNRVYPDGDNNKLLKLNVRGDIQEALYKAME